MLSRLRSRITYANVVATVALFVALGGSSYAALRITSKDVPRNALTGADIRDLTSRDIRNHSLLRRDFKRGQLLRGHKGARGLQGPMGATGDPGPLVDTLPSGKTLRGTYYALDDPAPAGNFAVDVISFTFALTATPNDHYLPPGSPSTPECPGNSNNPSAAAGQLCVYSQARANVDTSYSGDGMNFDHKDRFGFAVNVKSSGTASVFYDVGSWAVTAP